MMTKLIVFKIDPRLLGECYFFFQTNFFIGWKLEGKVVQKEY